MRREAGLSKERGTKTSKNKAQMAQAVMSKIYEFYIRSLQLVLAFIRLYGAGTSRE